MPLAMRYFISRHPTDRNTAVILLLYAQSLRWQKEATDRGLYQEKTEKLAVLQGAFVCILQGKPYINRPNLGNIEKTTKGTKTYTLGKPKNLNETLVGLYKNHKHKQYY